MTCERSYKLKLLSVLGSPPNFEILDMSPVIVKINIGISSFILIYWMSSHVM